MDSLSRAQAGVAGRLQIFIRNFKKCSVANRTKFYLEGRVVSLKEIYAEFLANHRLMCECEEAEASKHLYFNDVAFENFDELYHNTLAAIHEHLEEFDPPAVDTSVIERSEEHRNTCYDFKIPRLDLPNFNGSYDSWKSFHDMFVSAVHSNNKIPKVQKLQYLKSKLSDEAALLVSEIPVTEDNYLLAWQTLFDRYDNERVLVNSHVKNILSQPQASEDAQSIKGMLDSVKRSVQAIQNLGIDTNSWDCMLVHIVSQVMPKETCSLWEQSLSSNKVPTFKSLTEFLERRFRALEFIPELNKPHSKFIKKSESSSKRTQSFYTNSTDNKSSKCKMCGFSSHPLKSCAEFLKLTPEQRLNYIQSKNYCKNCFAYSHTTSKCPSPRRCSKCEQKHNSLLHLDLNKSKQNIAKHQEPNSNVATSSTEQEPIQVASLVTKLHSERKMVSPTYSDLIPEVLLATALINIRSTTGILHTFRALLDQGSQASFVTEHVVQLLGLKRNHMTTEVFGIGQSKPPKPRGWVEFEFSAHFDSSNRFNSKALILPTLTHLHPSQPLQLDLSVIAGLQLADPTYKDPGSIDILLSAGVLSKILLCEEVKRCPSTNLITLNTHLGWILFGEISEIEKSKQINCFHTTLESIDRTLRSFYEIEDLTPPMVNRTQEEEDCEKLYSQNYSRDTNGRYIVALPFKDGSPPSLGSSRDTAVARLHQVENRFRRDPEYKQLYVKSINNFLENKYMIPVKTTPEENLSITTNGSVNYRTCYLPHHGVFKAASESTKLRTVFDASSKTANGKSLNESMLVGPVLQNTLFHLILKWRIYPVALKADITQMYLQILVKDSDAEFQRIVWRANESDSIEDYKLRTVTFGTASAPFLAVRTLHQLAVDEASQFPQGARAVLEDFYMDDLISGAQTIEEALELQRQIIGLLKSGGFEIRKWSSNSEKVFNNVSSEFREITEGTLVKTLGIRWQPNTDHFLINTNPVIKIGITKRIMLSAISSIFDPLGWISPSIIKAKILLQGLWLSGTHWDDPLPSIIQDEWQALNKKLHCLEELRIPRWLGVTENTQFKELHVFCDASERAYAAAVYLRVLKPDGQYCVQLVAAKTRVAPLKQVTLPRLELCGAVLASKLTQQISATLSTTTVHIWTDSQIVLAWIRSHPSRWKSFVANRVTEIQSIANTALWHYVPSKENPSDCASRGICPSKLKDLKLWWNGPCWLTESEEKWPSQAKSISSATALEKRRIQTLSVLRPNIFLGQLLEKYSSISKLLRVTAYCLRWKAIVQKQPKESWLSSNEIKNALAFWVKYVQIKEFNIEIQQIKSDQAVSPKSKIAKLNPFLDKEGILRVGGRLRNSDLPFNEQHPIIIPKNSTFTHLLIDKAHRDTIHGGQALMRAFLQKDYWILDVRNALRYYIHKCVKCFRYSTQGLTQLMGDLPEPRVKQSRPFSHSGVDYAGPLEILTRRQRGRRQVTKGYICVFICLATKAIHLELISDYSTSSFLTGFSRFTARRGLPYCMYSDCGTNFVGANRCLNDDLHQLLHQLEPEIAATLANDGISWKFIPPAAPHFGGLWEAGVKSTKRHLRKVLGNSVLTYEELNTVLISIEGCLNSRPLCPMSNDIDDLSVLTPGHFLIGDSIKSPPRPNVLDLNINRLNIYQELHRLQQHFWRQWSKDYLNRLQSRPKWLEKRKNLEVGDLVLLLDDRFPPSKWPLGRIIGIYPGKDSLVRAALVKTTTTELKRPVTKLCLLPKIDSLPENPSTK